MPASSVSSRSQLQRTATWPPTSRVVADAPGSHEPGLHSMSAATESTPSYDAFDDMDDHPQDHFLSPMQYEDWASDSDDDGEEIEWTAGITDFALFDDDRRRAQENGKQPDARWDDFLATQRSAFERCVQRSQSELVVDTTKPPLPVEDVPSLTPDNSPSLKDDLDGNSHAGPSPPKLIVPDYLTVIITPPSPKDRMIEDDDDLPLTFSLHRDKPRKQATRKVQRPGLRHTRTMSGKAHVWRRPDWNIYTVGEDPEAEKRAEQGMIRRLGGLEDLRGGRGSRDG